MNKLKTFYAAIAVSAIFMLALSSCKKEPISQAADDSALFEAQLLIDDADLAYSQTLVTDGSETLEIQAENEGLPEAYTLIETDMDDAGFKRGLEKRFLLCLKKLELSDEQTRKVRAAFRNYELCKAADLKGHREAYARLHARIEAARKELLAKLRAGTITKAQFETKMKALKSEFEQGLKHIKEAYAKRIKACYEKFVRALKEILNERQWKAFVSCYR